MNLTQTDFPKVTKASARAFTAIDLFCGCGAVSLGLKKAGFHVLSAIDFEPMACATYRKNHPEVQLVEKDICNIKPTELLPSRGENLSLMVVCAPCQPFSSQNKYKDGDKRAKLILQAIRFARVLKPRLILFENVPGLASGNNRSIMNKLNRGLKKLGYAVSAPLKVNAADYSVPQRRMRCIMFASLDGLPELPEPSTPIGLRNTVRTAIGDLEPLSSGQKSIFDPYHFARQHTEIALNRMSHIPKDGGGRFSLPPELELPCHKGTNAYPDVYGRMRWDDIAPTLTTGCTDITRGRFMHPTDNRAITLREAARLQTFPDTFVFTGNAGDIAQQIGNAVPVNLAYVMGNAIIHHLQNIRN